MSIGGFSSALNPFQWSTLSQWYTWLSHDDDGLDDLPSVHGGTFDFLLVLGFPPVSVGSWKSSLPSTFSPRPSASLHTACAACALTPVTPVLLLSVYWFHTVD